MQNDQDQRPTRLSHIIHDKIALCRDPALPILEDKFHAKVLAELFDVPAVPLLFHCRDPRQLGHFFRTRADTLPDFIVKTNHGVGDYCIVRRLEPGLWHLSGKDVDETGPVDLLSRKLVSLYWDNLLKIHSLVEWAVAMIWPRRILVEPYIKTNDDYKVVVTGGEAVFTYCVTGRFSEEGLAVGVFDRDWNFLGAILKTIDRYGKERGEQLLRERFPKPGNLASLYRNAERLSPSHLPLQRVDFYRTTDGEFLMGEITSYSAGGTDSMLTEVGVERKLVQMILDRKPRFGRAAEARVVRLERGRDGDEISQDSFRRAYLEVMHGADIVLHADALLGQEDLSRLIDEQGRLPGRIVRLGSNWSWDRQGIFSWAEKLMHQTTARHAP